MQTCSAVTGSIIVRHCITTFGSNQVVYQMIRLILFNTIFIFMLKISREDYRSLELKIQVEIKKIFSQFLKDLENKTIEPDETVLVQEQQKPGCPPGSVPGETTPIAAKPKRPRMSKKSIEVNRILHRTSHEGTKPRGNILEDDMAKIFRKKHRRGSH